MKRDYKLSSKPKKQGTWKFFAFIIASFIIIRLSLYDGLCVRTYTIDSSYTENLHVFAFLTDLHSTLYGKNQKDLIDAIEKQSPEAVFMAGDIGDDKRDFSATAVLLDALTERYPCYYTIGNHERWVEYSDDVKKLFESYRVTVLSGNSVFLGDGIMLHGIDDPVFYSSEQIFLEALEDFDVDDGNFDILLSHRPEYAELYSSLGFELSLCGHAHGGQVRFPLLLNGLYAPNQGFFPKYAGGKYTINDSSVVVSRGLMKNEIPRIFNPPELVVLHVK